MAIVETFYCFCYFQVAAANIMKIPIIATEQVSKYNFLFAFQCFFFIEKLMSQNLSMCCPSMNYRYMKTNLRIKIKSCGNRISVWWQKLFEFVLQYPKGLGNTVEEIDTSFFKERIFPKTKFSMVIPEVEEQLRQLNIENVVLMGIEVSTIDYDKYSTPPFTLHDIVL